MTEANEKAMDKMKAILTAVRSRLIAYSCEAVSIFGFVLVLLAVVPVMLGYKWVAAGFFVVGMLLAIGGVAFKAIILGSREMEISERIRSRNAKVGK